MLIDLFRRIYYFNLRSLLFNFYYLPFKQAIKFPITISRKVKIRDMSKNNSKKRFVLNAEKISPCMIKIGFDGCGFIDFKYERTLIELSKNGQIIFRGNCFIGSASKLGITENAKLDLGTNCSFTGKTKIFANENIQFGSNSLIAWDTMFLTSDFHKIIYDGNVCNSDSGIIIKENTWICSNVTILKGSQVPANSVVVSGTIFNKKMEEENCLYGNRGGGQFLCLKVA